MLAKDITINARKSDGVIHRTWQADLIKQTDSLLVFEGVFDHQVKHPDLGVIRPGTISYEYYWLDRWYNVFRFHEPTGELRNYYCNINKPPTFRNGVLDYIDLEIDIVVWHNFDYQILDMEEFLENSVLYKYSEQTKRKVKKTIAELEQLISVRAFPFSEIETYQRPQREP